MLKAISATFSPTNTPLTSANSGSAYTFDLNPGIADFAITLTANTTFTFPSGLGTGRRWEFYSSMIQDSTGGRTITWPSSTILKWPSGTVPTLTTTASAVSFFAFTSDNGGTVWDGFLLGDNLS